MSSNDPLLTALTCLLPIYTTSTLPKPLISLATALLAQSRSVASSLKPEEEAARSTVIADIAVERLKTRLNLSKATPRPPCGPRIYKKLYTYLDTALPAPSVSSRQTPGATPTKPQRTRDALATPTKGGTPTRTPARPVTGGLDFGSIGKVPALSGKGTSAGHGNEANDDGVPSWVGMTIRHICRKLAVEAAVPHIYVGVATLFKPSFSTANTHALSSSLSPTKSHPSRQPKPGAPDFDLAVKLPALIITITQMVVKRMFPSNNKVTGTAVAHELVALGKVTSKRLREVMGECERLEEEEWEEMEWIGNVPIGEIEEEGEDTEMRDELGDGAGGTIEDRIVVKRTVPRNDTAIASIPATTTTSSTITPQQQPTLSPSQTSPQPTTNQPRRSQRPPRPRSAFRDPSLLPPTGLGAINWLTPARRADYKKWEALVLRRLAILEQNLRVQADGGGAPGHSSVGRKRKADVLSSPARG